MDHKLDLITHLSACVEGVLDALVLSSPHHDPSTFLAYSNLPHWTLDWKTRSGEGFL